MAQFENKIVAVVNENIEPGRAMMALSHAMLGFGAGLTSRQEVRLNRYVDASNCSHEPISEMPIVVLKGSSNKIRELRKSALSLGLKFADFCDTMSIGTYEEECELTKTKKDEELSYWAIVIFGPQAQVSELTKKFSLYR